jgi:hypothetical protein
LHKNTNGTFDHGAFQINDIWLPVLKRMGSDYDVDASTASNTNAALYVLTKQGHQAWRRSTNGDLLAQYQPIPISGPPVGTTWSTPIMVTKRFSLAIAPGDEIRVCPNKKCDAEHIQVASITSPLHLGDTLIYIQFQSNTDSAIPAVFTFK